MQDSKITETEYKSEAHKLLSQSLQEMNGQKEEGDTKLVAEKCECSVRTVEVYLGGDIASLETGKKIFTTLRDIVIKRQRLVIKEVNKKVA